LSGTAALFTGAAMLGAVGAWALYESQPTHNVPEPAVVLERTASATPPSSDSAPSSVTPGALTSVTGDSTRPPAPGRDDEQLTSGPRFLPDEITVVAERFVVAWVAADTRPGGDAPGDSGRRAAAFAAPALAADLRQAGDAASRQWQRWAEKGARVGAQVFRVTIPDGAPDATDDTAFARVLYRMTVAPQAGPAVTTEEQVALELRRDTSGVWRVAALPNG
jgi:hypothetical protein